MIEQIKTKIKSLLALNESLFDQFWHDLKPYDIKKGEFYIQEGDFSGQIALVTKGAFYSFYVKDGNEIIEDFCFEACFIADYPSFINNLPSKKNFKALENSELLTISKSNLENFYSQRQEFERAGRFVAEFLFTSWELKLRDTIFLSPTERYQKLIKERPHILQRVPQYLIASYLNITPQYLSQIRNKRIS